MRYIIKGGIWKNAEDEVLKAAVMKYGLNQWSRISSLLVRKSAKECKARWYEWLDPSIKKTEWSREEEEKLLHLSKIFPCQWRTIAPILQRTPAQCVEHYEKLLDRAQGKEEQDENDPRKLRPGEIDPNPEAKPARPDEVDMDEDVKEMLQEARARLANTRGKKAKRKAREKILDEARRLANLQKKRELKAAGIDFNIPKRGHGINYNIETPFKRDVPEGRFKAGPEEEPVPDKFKSAVSLQQIEGKRRDEELKKRKAIDQKRLKKLKDKNMPKALNIISKMTESGIVHKREIVLPEPQISDAELHSIGKMTQNTGSTQQSAATQVLIGNYTQKEPTPMVARTPMIEDSVLREAQSALMMRESQTPLVGGQAETYKTPLPPPSQNVVPRTPNTLLMKGQQKETIFRQPTTGKRTGKIPSRNTDNAGILRDKLKINAEEEDKAWENKNQNEQILERIEPSKSITDLLKNLPAPQNEYNIELPEGLEEIPEENEPKITEIQEDMEDIEAKDAAKKQKEEQEELEKVSMTIRRNLPRPYIALRPKTPFSLENPEANELIDSEIEKLIEYDNFVHPGKFIKQTNKKPYLEEFSREELLNAKEIISESQKQNPIENRNILESDLFKNWDNTLNKLLYFPGIKQYDTITDKSLAEIVESKEKLLEKYNAHFEKLRKDISKLESKSPLAGYYKEEYEIKEKAKNTSEKQGQDKLKKIVFDTLKLQEERAMKLRQIELERFLSQAQDTENKLQEKYKELLDKKNMLLKSHGK